MMKRKNKSDIKNIRDDFTATPNPFNQNLNYEKILRFSPAKVRENFIRTNYFEEKFIFLFGKIVKIH